MHGYPSRCEIQVNEHKHLQALGRMRPQDQTPSILSIKLPRHVPISCANPGFCMLQKMLASPCPVDDINGCINPGAHRQCTGSRNVTCSLFLSPGFLLRWDVAFWWIQQPCSNKWHLGKKPILLYHVCVTWRCCKCMGVVVVEEHFNALSLLSWLN